MPEFKLDKPVIILAPMAGYTDAPMRETVSHFGADAVVSEMLASQEWKTGRKGCEARVMRGDLAPNTRYIVQIAGRDANLMGEVARYAQDQGADQVDINMGCPARKIVAGATAGAALLREPKLALKIVEVAANSIDIPLSVKTRLGWDTHDFYSKVNDFENAGAQFFSIHGRTRNQHYEGCADWQAVGEIKARASVPVFVNGDIINANDAKNALQQSGADGVMIGRAAIGHPWLLGQVSRALKDTHHKEDACAENKNAMITIRSHFDRIIAHYGEELGILNARKHLKAYFSGASPSWLKSLLMERDPAHLRRLLEEPPNG